MSSTAATVSPPRPDYSGSLATPPEALLLRILREKLCGTLVVEEASGERSGFYFQAGMPKQSKALRSLNLGDLLIRTGVDEKLVAQSYEKAVRHGMLHGEALVHEGVLQPNELDEALRDQLVEHLRWLLSLPQESRWGFFANQNLLRKWRGRSTIDVDPLRVIWSSIQEGNHDECVARACETLSSGTVSVDNDRLLSPLEFDANTQTALDLLRTSPLSLQDLVDRTAPDPQRTKRLLYVAYLIGAVTHHPARVSTSDAPQGQSPFRASGWCAHPPREATYNQESEPPASSEVVKDPREVELDQYLEGPEPSYYEILGLKRDCSAKQIQESYHRFAKRWHPDKFGRESEAAKKAQSWFGKGAEAHRILSNPAWRQKYDVALLTGNANAQAQERVQRVLGAASSFLRAEVLLKRNDLGRAKTEVLRALESDPAQSDAAALLAWIEAHDENADLSRCVKQLSSVLNDDTENEKARFYRAKLLQRMGHQNRAYADFKAIVERNPKHVDAAREVRLHRLRSHSSGQLRQPFFARLFGKNNDN